VLQATFVAAIEEEVSGTCPGFARRGGDPGDCGLSAMS